MPPTVRIVKAKTDVMDSEYRTSLDEEIPNDTGYFTRLDFVANNDGITQTIWGIDPMTLEDSLEEMLK